MTTAPPADQRQLLDIQQLDTRLAQLAHQRRRHPSLETLEELQGRADDLQRAQTQADAAVTDTRRELTKAEADVEQVRTRLERGTQRLNAGEGSPKDLQALSGELEVMERRQTTLEEEQLEVMERLEGAESDRSSIAEQLAAIQVQQSQVQSERDAAFERIDAEVETTTTTRNQLASGIDADLLALYERIRSKTGGLAAVALEGEMTVGVQLPLSLSEKAAIRDAAPEQVIRSEDYDYLLIRVD